MPSAACPRLPKHQPRMMFPIANGSRKPCSFETATTSFADRSIVSAELAPSIAQLPYQAWRSAKARMKGESRCAAARASSRRKRASSRWPRQSNVRERWNMAPT